MSERVSTFTKVRAADYKYIFFIVGWNEWNKNLNEDLTYLTENLGEFLGPDALVVRPYEPKAYDTYEEVKAKDWPDKWKERIAAVKDPFMLIIPDIDFKDFEPERDPWAIIWFPDNHARDATEMLRLFQTLAKKVKDGESLFDYLRSLAAQNEGKKVAQLFSRYVDAGKLQVFGVSINLQAILEDITGSHV